MNPPAFQFYADDFIAGVADMTQAEVGAYILLLCRQWNRGSIPNDPERLKLMAKGKVSAHVLQKFIKGDDGALRNQRMEKGRTSLTEFSETQSESGRKGAKVRWEGHVKEMATPSKINGDPIGQPIIPPLANGMAENGSPVSVSSLQTPLKTPLPPLGKGESVQPSMPEGFEKFWAAYPKKEGKLAAVKAWGKIPSPVATLPRMLEAIASQKKTESWTKDGGQFIPHPATWLNAGRWMDALTVEVAPKAVGGNF